MLVAGGVRRHDAFAAFYIDLLIAATCYQTDPQPMQCMHMEWWPCMSRRSTELLGVEQQGLESDVCCEQHSGRLQMHSTSQSMPLACVHEQVPFGICCFAVEHLSLHP